MSWCIFGRFQPEASLASYQLDIPPLVSLLPLSCDDDHNHHDHDHGDDDCDDGADDHDDEVRPGWPEGDVSGQTR